MPSVSLANAAAASEAWLPVLFFVVLPHLSSSARRTLGPRALCVPELLIGKENQLTLRLASTRGSFEELRYSRRASRDITADHATEFARYGENSGGYGRYGSGRDHLAHSLFFLETSSRPWCVTLFRAPSSSLFYGTTVNPEACVTVLSTLPGQRLPMAVRRGVCLCKF